MSVMRQFELVERVKSYDPGADEEAINRAYVFAMKMHGSQLRASGDPYFSHPIEVAGLLTKYRLDAASIITALLHDTIEDTPATLEEVEKLFGAEVARLVDGVTKLSRIELQSDHAKQAENLRKLLLATSEDIRVLLVKLADRTHNMRTLKYIQSPEKRRRIALETSEIYAPLAELIGLQEIKTELEDLAFAELHPDARASIVTRLDQLRQQGGDVIATITEDLTRTFAEAGVNATLSGREKTPFSIWAKMKKKNVGMEQLSDIMAFRVVVDNLDECYRALGAVHSKYPVDPGRFKDYISTPKRNGYKSLHTGVFGPGGHRIEIQIRSRDMHEVAELGVAAHWQYKGSGDALPPSDASQYRWLHNLLDIEKLAVNSEEFLEHTKLEMFQDQVFCFSPKGTLIDLPRGATPVDFAYAVHSEIGDHCVGAKINGRMMKLDTPLNNGDQVEILTTKMGTPNPAWDAFVVTGKARARIRRFMRTRQRAEFVALGRNMLNQAFHAEGYDYTDKAIDGVLKVFKAQSAEDLIALVGEGHQSARDIVLTVFPELKTKAKTSDNAIPPIKRKAAHEPGSRPHQVQIKGLIPGLAVHFPNCCHPLPGDRIVGIVTTGKGVTIHTIDCENLEHYSDAPERWLDVGWGETDGVDHPGRVHMVVANEPGTLSTITTVIAKNLGNITNLKMTNRTPDFFDLLIDIEVRDVRHLTNIIAALRATPSIASVERARG